MVDRPIAVSVGEALSTVRPKGVMGLEAVALREDCPSFRVTVQSGHLVEMPFNSEPEAPMNFSCGVEAAKAVVGSEAIDWSRFEPVFSGRSALIPVEVLPLGAVRCVTEQAESIEKITGTDSWVDTLTLRDASGVEIRLVSVESRRVGLSHVVSPLPRIVVEERAGRRVAVVQAVWQESTETCRTLKQGELEAALGRAPEATPTVPAANQDERLPASSSGL